jgi:catechol 2,3-dioxygenase-like lactoylglutathione lyase family enzyme
VNRRHPTNRQKDQKMLQAIDHINIVVSDLDRSVHFYTTLMGFTEVRRVHLEGEWIESIVGLRDVSADVVYLTPPEGGTRLELLQYHSPEGMNISNNSSANTKGIRHLALRVSDIHSVIKRLEEAGVKVVGSPVKVPGRVVKYSRGEKTLCYLLDPDGVIIELAEYR